ncbi:hypothetical protein NL676_005089 [Syzygium grande]|nr:hypothetical protein NL676_005089 [Syzygium grande]
MLYCAVPPSGYRLPFPSLENQDFARVVSSSDKLRLPKQARPISRIRVSTPETSRPGGGGGGGGGGASEPTTRRGWRATRSAWSRRGTVGCRWGRWCPIAPGAISNQVTMQATLILVRWTAKKTRFWPMKCVCFLWTQASARAALAM